MRTWSLTKVAVQKELNRVSCWISLNTYTNIRWSIYLSPAITWSLLRTIYILHNPSHAIYIFSCIVFLDIFHQVDECIRNIFFPESHLITLVIIKLPNTKLLISQELLGIIICFNNHCEALFNMLFLAINIFWGNKIPWRYKVLNVCI